MADIDKITLRGVNYSIIDSSVPSYVKSITQTDITNWNNKLSSFTETDPTVPSYVKGITEEDIENWNNKLDSFTETDPTVPSHVKSITQQNITDWNNKLSEHQDLSSYVKWAEKNEHEQNTNTLSANVIRLSSSTDRYIYGNGGIQFDDAGLRLVPNGNNELMISDVNDDTTQYYFREDKQGDVAITNDITKAINSYVILASYISSSSLNTTLSSYATSANYDSSTKKIYLKHGTTTLSEIDATDFIKDGMVDTAYVQGANLVISFNTDAGKEAVNVPISDIFNANNYYTKSEIDNAGYLTSFTETDPTVPSHVKSITQQNINNWNNKLSSETQLSKGTTTGSGNAVTDISVSNHQITLTKGSTFLTEHQSIKTINGNTITGTGNVTINELPTVTSSDNGKVLQVVNGQWQLVTPLNLYSGSGTPNNAQGNNGDIYLQI